MLNHHMQKILNNKFFELNFNIDAGEKYFLMNIN